MVDVASDTVMAKETIGPGIMDYTVSTIVVIPNWAIWVFIVLMAANIALHIIEIRAKK